MNMIRITRDFIIEKPGTRRETSKLLCAIYAPVELREGLESGKMGNNAMETPVIKL